MFLLCTDLEVFAMLSAMAIDSPVGRLTISATPYAIIAIAWTDDPQGEPTPYSPRPAASSRPISSAG